MTRSFNVLDPNEDIHQSYLLEASAGTGKTFAIENIVVRKLLEGDVPLKLEEMIIVTFTKAAVADLKRRIYKNLKKTYRQSGNPKLDDALQSFHEASIYTIHGFCQRMLLENGFEGGTATGSVGDLPVSLFKRIITDFIQVAFNSNLYSLRQIEGLKKGKSIEKLISSLITWVKKDVPCIENPPLSYQKQQLESLWNKCGNDPLEVIRALVPDYKSLTNAEKWISQPVLGSDFDALLDIADNVLAMITPENKKKTVKTSNPIPEDLKIFRDTALKYVSNSHLFSDLIEKCRHHVENYCRMEDLTPFDALLKKMKTACSNPAFAKSVRQKYKLAIVDEFQDTDPVQWSIFKSLFSDAGQLILVGDPKQSIYGFRQADIYTYQSAAQSLGPEALRSLDTNFRSTPPLVDALNTLFNTDYTPGWIPLPRTRSTMCYRPVNAGRVDDMHEGGITIQITLSEEELFTSIANTIIEKKHAPATTAILVKDQFQASRIAKVLQKSRIPHVLQKQELLTETDAWSDWLTLLNAIQQPKSRSLVKNALGTTFIGFTHLEIRTLESEDQLSFFMEQFSELKKCWLANGISLVSEKINSRLIFQNECLRVRLLKKEGGSLYLHQMEQIQDIFMEEESIGRLSPQELILRGKELQEFSSEEDNRLLSLQDHVQEGVRILTIHSSKGLEFETVFTPGIIQKGAFKDELVPHANPEQKFYPFLSKEEPFVVAHKEEYDAEKMRQLYVALTRAKKWLYIPFIPCDEKGCKYGEASPIQLFFGRMGQPQYDSSHDLYDAICNLTSDKLEQIIPKHPAITLERISSEEPLQFDFKRPDRPIFPPTIPVIPGQNASIESFTSLSQKCDHITPPTIQQKSTDPIPAGTETGIILHKIFECIDFSNPISLPYLQGTILEPWSEKIESLVLQATRYKFPEGFTLSDIPQEDQFREMEFLYPSPSGYIKGVIDLIFRYNDKIHILDWKSNLLHDYAASTLEESMNHHNYFLQAKLYKEAVRRYFGDTPIAIDYFFVRGATSFRLEASHVE